MKLVLLSIAFLFILSSSLCAQATSAPSGIRFELTADKPKHLLGEDVRLKFSIVNASSDAYTFEAYGDGIRDPVLIITATAAGGTLAPGLRLGGFAWKAQFRR
jgi:hypothetical protein